MQVLNKPKLKVSKERVFEKIVEILLLNRVQKADAEITAEVLIEGTLRGYNNHGIDRIFQILEGLELGSIKPNAFPTVLKECLATSVIDGHHALGYPIGKQAMVLAIEKAKKFGVGVVGVINTSHIGILAYYSEIASREGCIGIVMSTSSPAVVIKGGKIKTFGTNPISYSLPFHPHPITADCATSKVSRGLIYEYLAKGKTIPLGWAVDHNGLNTEDPSQALEGGLQSFDGDIKGNIFSMLISILAGNLIGGVMNPNVTGTRDMSEEPNKGDLFIALNVESFTDQNFFREGIQDLTNFIKNQNSDFRIPGENSHKQRQSHKEGISLSAKMEVLFNM
jgi:L-2-hydroxycarboxylate dehydrogenase (NAD+)